MLTRSIARGDAIGLKLITTIGVIGLSLPAAAQSRATSSQDVAPILYEHCVACHRPGQIAPFSLLTYSDVRPQALAIARATRSRTMPPWKPEPGFGDFDGEQRLTDQQIDAIQRWADAGAVEGDPSTLPPAPHFTDGWRLGQPDLVVSMPQPYLLPATGPDTLRNFVIPIPIRSGKYVRG